MIDSNSDLFKSWVELTSPIWEILGSDVNDVVSLKRWLAFLEGGLLPIISLTSLHFFVKYDELDLENKKVIDEVVEKKNEFEEVESIDEEPVTYSEESVESIESIESEVLESEDSVEEIVENEVQDVPDTNVVEITENVEPISESQQRIIDNAKQWGWRLTPYEDRLIVNWPDPQGRLFKNLPYIEWKRRLHEKVEGAKTYVHLPAVYELALHHNKTIEKQIQTNIKYNKMFTEEENKGFKV